MAKIFIEETTLSNIGNAIRDKEGTSDLIPVNDMASRISAITTGGNELTDEELTITGDCSYRFSNNGWSWFIDKYGDRITTKDITNCSSMFYNSGKSKNIPFQINVNDCENLSYLFQNCYELTTIPKIRGSVKWTTNTNFVNSIMSCYKVRDIEDLFTPEMLEGFSTVKVTNAYGTPKPMTFQYCHSLRAVPSWWYKLKINENSTVYPAGSYCLYYALTQQCYALDEVNNIPVWKCAGAQTTDMFYRSFESCSRLKNVTFETNADGTPIQVAWKSQTIDLTKYVGYYYTSSSQYSFSEDVAYRQRFVDSRCYNSGITEDKLIYNDETYQRLKDDPDSFALDCGTSDGDGRYSRYNHDSAVATINSLPDTSAYLATAGGTNTIKFKGAAGSKTDGGAINTLTEEEIAVATAKGWTVTFA